MCDLSPHMKGNVYAKRNCLAGLETKKSGGTMTHPLSDGKMTTTADSSLISLIQGHFKGESVVGAIMPSLMEVSYCAFRFFRS